MESINISNKYVTVFINSSQSLSKQAKAFAVAEIKFVNIIDVLNDTPTAIQLLDVATKCGVDIGSLFNTNEPLYLQKVKEISNFSNEDKANILAQSPELMRTPFLVKDTTLKFFNSSADFTI